MVCANIAKMVFLVVGLSPRRMSVASLELQMAIKKKECAGT